MTRILHIDDDPIFLDLVKAIFADDPSISVVSCLNAHDALGIVESLHPDLIISDISMPDMGGLELANKIRKLASTSATPIVFVSGRTRDLEVYEAFRKMAADVLQKPVDPSFLRQRVKALLDESAPRADYELEE